MGLQMLDDHARFDDHFPSIEEQREFSKPPMAFQFVHEGYGFGGLEMAIVEPGLIGVKRDQHLLRVTAERVPEELQAHQAPASIFARRSSSTWLGSPVAKLPVGTSPEGS